MGPLLRNNCRIEALQSFLHSFGSFLHKHMCGQPCDPGAPSQYTDESCIVIQVLLPKTLPKSPINSQIESATRLYSRGTC